MANSPQAKKRARQIERRTEVKVWVEISALDTGASAALGPVAWGKSN